MDLLLGTIVWGGLLLLVLSWIGRTGLTGRRSGGAAASGSRAWSSTVPPAAATQDRARHAELAELREDEALADGLVIGHHLTRDHYTDRIGRLEDELDDLTVERARLHEGAAAGDDLFDELDHAEFDAMGGFGVEPWADDLFNHDEEE